MQIGPITTQMECCVVVLCTPKHRYFNSISTKIQISPDHKTNCEQKSIKYPPHIHKGARFIIIDV